MENISPFSNFAARFAAAPLQSLVGSFNRQVGSAGWAAIRAAHNNALIDELIRRGIDISAISDGTRTSFAHHIRIENNRVVLTD